ncbi:MAG TPA: PAS domain S-box protein [Campylobacterales bacterium]|nr:PAS domain S-box protein [Campylobacterales bacterium]
MKFYRPLPLNEEVKINAKEFIVSKTDANGKILYTNEFFTKVTGYTQSEVVGQSHNILRHPDMPGAIFFLMWQRIRSGQNITALVKNLAKSGKYYWVTTDFEIQKDIVSNNVNYIAFRRTASKKAIQAITPLYQTLLEIEKKHGLEASLVHLQGYLDERHTDFDAFMESIVKPKGLIGMLFERMKKHFRQAA